MTIFDLLSKAESLRNETALNSVTPERVGEIAVETLNILNEYQIQNGGLALQKVYTSVSSMQSDKSPVSDFTKKFLRRGQLVVIVPNDQADATAGDVYRYDGPSGNTSAWTFVAKIGGVPADSELNASSTNPVQNKVVTEKLTELSKVTIQKIGGTISSSSDSSLSYGYESRIDFRAIKGSKIRLDIDNQSAFVNGKTIAFVSDGFSATIYKQFPFDAFDVEFQNDATYVRCSVNPDGVKTVAGVAFTIEVFGLLSGKVNELSEEITYQIGENYSATAATHLSYGYANHIDQNLSKGATIHISIDNQSAFVNGKTIAFVSDGFATIYKPFPFDAFDVELQNDATYVRCSVNPDGVKSVADVAFAIDVFGLLSGKVNELEQKNKDLFKSIARPIITIIDDDTLGYDSVKLFHDVCVQNGIKGTYATLTSIALSDDRLIPLMQQYEQEGFHFAIHGKTQSPSYSPQFDAADAEKDFVEGMRQMQSANFLDWKFFIIPYGAYQPELQHMAKKWGCKCAVGIGQNSYINTSEKVNRFYLPRAGFNAQETGSVTFDQLKALIDEAASNNGWVLVGTHIYDGWTEELLTTKFAEMVQYAKNAGLTFVTLNEGYRQFEPFFIHNEMH